MRQNTTYVESQSDRSLPFSPYTASDLQIADFKIRKSQLLKQYPSFNLCPSFWASPRLKSISLC